MLFGLICVLFKNAMADGDWNGLKIIKNETIELNINLEHAVFHSRQTKIEWM